METAPPTSFESPHRQRRHMQERLRRMLAGLGGAVVVPGTAVGTPNICRVLSPFIRGSYRQEGHASTTDTWSCRGGHAAAPSRVLRGKSEWARAWLRMDSSGCDAPPAAFVMVSSPSEKCGPVDTSSAWGCMCMVHKSGQSASSSVAEFALGSLRPCSAP